jgi:hypothetical protein
MDDAVESAGAKAPAITISTNKSSLALGVLCQMKTDVARRIRRSASAAPGKRNIATLITPPRARTGLGSYMRFPGHREHRFRRNSRNKRSQSSESAM